MRKLSIPELAVRANVSVMSVYNWEAGRHRPRYDNVAALCKVLRVDIDEAMAMTEP